MISGYNHVIVSESNRPFVSTNGLGAGNVRYNTSSQGLEAFDGYSWIPISISATVGLSPSATSAINWAIDQMYEDQELKTAAAKSPAVQAAVDAVRKATDQLKTIIILSKDEETTS